MGTLAYIGGLAKINKDVPPFMIADGHVATIRGVNVYRIEAGPRLLQLRTRPGVAGKLPRPDRTPAEVGRRLMAHLGIAAPWACGWR